MPKKSTKKKSTAKPPLKLIKSPAKEPVLATTFQTRNMLVDFTISSFQTRKLDRGVTAEIAKQYDVSESVGNYRKRLFPFADQDLDALPRRIAQLRQFHRSNTLPWGNGDTDLRVLPAQNFLTYSEGIREGRQEIERLAQTVADRLPELKERARQELERQGGPVKGKSMFNEDDYPDQASFTSRHQLRVNFMPIPDADSARRIEFLDAEQIEAIRDDAREQLIEAQSAAMFELWQRVAKIVSHAREMLSDRKRKLRDELFENAKALCELAPRLNFENNPQLTEIVSELRETMASYDPVFVRKSRAVRKRVADSLEEIEEKMKSFMPANAQAA